MIDTIDLDALQGKVVRASDELKELRRVLVAFSGGVDSSVLLRLAVHTLGRENVLAVTAEGPLHPEWEKKQSQNIAQLIGAVHIFTQDHSCRVAEFVKNTAQRCYYCKKAMLEDLQNLAEEHQMRAIVAGENADDQFDYRPGARAMTELGIHCPLKNAHITKAEVRVLAKEWQLPNYDTPSSPCLATRVAYGQPITSELLSQIEQAESLLRELGFKIVRVRIHGAVARIEVCPSEINRFFEPSIREQVLIRFRELGFTYTSIDLAGYESGGLNKLIAPEERL
jgi:uncharacterized protein